MCVRVSSREANMASQMCKLPVRSDVAAAVVGMAGIIMVVVSVRRSVSL